jgi:hypothetical protein
MGISKTCSLVSEFEERVLAEIDQEQLISLGTPFLFRKQSKKVFCRENGEIEVVELTMMKASNSSNNAITREIIVKLVYMECISHWDEGC